MSEKKAAAPAKVPRYYPAEPLPRKKVTREATPVKLRASITPGTVVIILAGRFRGKRAVFLKQLKSGLLLVTGPYAVNGIPLRRVNQAYVIATKTKVDLSSVKLDLEKFNDDYFKRPTQTRAQKASGIIAKDKKEPKEKKPLAAGEEKKRFKRIKVSSFRKSDQKAVDAVLVPVVRATPNLNKYLGARFTLRTGQFPHRMVF